MFASYHFPALMRKRKHFSSVVKNRATSAKYVPPLPFLRCPGGPRMNAEGIKRLFKVPHAGYLAKYDHRFILNLKLTHQIVSHLSKKNWKTSDKLLIELGPGAGSLTRSLLTRPCVGVLGIESDSRYNVLLQQIESNTNRKFRWINGDILKLDEAEVIASLFPSFASQHRHEYRKQPDGSMKPVWKDLRNEKRESILHDRKMKASGGGEGVPPTSSEVWDEESTSMDGVGGDSRVELIANLPFSIISELLIRYSIDASRHKGLFQYGRVPLHCFVQSEVGERLTAPSGSIHFSRLSVLLQNVFHVHLQHKFTQQTYYPNTEVLGALVSFTPRTVPLVDIDGSVLVHFCDIFMRPGSRGKKVGSVLSKVVPPEVAQYMLQELRLDSMLYISELTVEETARLGLMWYRFLKATNQYHSDKSDLNSQHETISKTNY